MWRHEDLFGARARGGNKLTSGLDVYVDYGPSSKFSILDLIGIKLLLEDELALDIHITTKSSLHPMLKDKIEQQSLCVF
jgi:uncharacterized protein